MKMIRPQFSSAFPACRPAGQPHARHDVGFEEARPVGVGILEEGLWLKMPALLTRISTAGIALTIAAHPFGCRNVGSDPGHSGGVDAVVHFYDRLVDRRLLAAVDDDTGSRGGKTFPRWLDRCLRSEPVTRAVLPLRSIFIIRPIRDANFMFDFSNQRASGVIISAATLFGGLYQVPASRTAIGPLGAMRQGSHSIRTR